jgi:hypothetical protein
MKKPTEPKVDLPVRNKPPRKIAAHLKGAKAKPAKKRK